MTEKKAAPKAKKETLEDRVKRLEEVICKMAHYNGGNNPRICREAGLEPYQPNKKDMGRF